MLFLATATDLQWVTGAVVVTGLILAIIGLATYGILDVARQYRNGDWPKPPTASNWVMLWAMYRPIIPFLFGLVAGILAAHFFWYQVRPCG